MSVLSLNRLLMPRRHRIPVEMDHAHLDVAGEQRLALALLQDAALKLRTAADVGILDLDTMRVDDEKADFVPSQRHRKRDRRRLRGGFGGEYTLSDVRSDVAFWDSELPSRLMSLIDPDTRGLDAHDRRQYLCRMRRSRRPGRRIS